MYKLFTLLLFIFNINFFYAQGFYPLSINDSLSKNANVIIRKNITSYKLLSDNKIEKTVNYVVTILNSQGKDYSYLIVNYDKFTKIDEINGLIYNELGQVITKIKKKDIQDMSAISSYSFFEDDRMKVYVPLIKKYPITIEYNYKTTRNNTFFSAIWTPYSHFDYNIGVEKSELNITAQNESDIRYYSSNINKKPSININKNEVTYSWSFSNLIPKEYEKFSPPIIEQIPYIKLAPKNFTIENYSGNMSTWKNFGQTISEFNKDRLDLPQESKNYIKKLVSQTTDTVKMIKLIYQYMQSKTRYVSIQLGIGGWQPFEASFVDEKGYGDCKALSNYTKALLNIVGIKSYYTLVKAGENPNFVKEDFPSISFNHAILCVPTSKDTIWLECTNQQIPFGFIGDFTDNRNVLLITKNGGKFVKTKEYKLKDNFENTYSKVIIDETGNATAEISSLHSSIFYGDIMPILNQPKEIQKKWLYKNINIPDFKINDFTFTDNHEDFIPTANNNTSLEIINFAKKTGDRLFIPLNLFKDSDFLISDKNERQNDIYIRYSYSKTDTCFYTFPEQYKIEYLPKSDLIKSQFGEIKYSISNDNNKIIYARKLIIYQGNYSKEKYSDFCTFINSLNKIDNIKAVIIKN